MSFLKLMKPEKVIFLTLLAVLILNYSVTYSFSAENSNINKTKILLISLDGATWTIIDPLIKAGKLPNIKQLMDKGSHGILESFDPLISEVIWTSIATGTSPHRHGITDRFVTDPDTNSPGLVTSNLRKTKAIWNILSAYKKRVGVIGYRGTWPPEDINGVMISDRNTVITTTSNYLSKDYSYPPFTNICTRLEFENFFDIKNSVFLRMERESAQFDMSIEKRDHFMANFSKYLLQKQDFDFFAIYLAGIDILSHYFWKYTFPDGFDVPKNDIERYNHLVTDYYIWCDEIIGDLTSLIDQNTVIIIVSDHGFKSSEPRYGYETGKFKFDSILTLTGLSAIKEGDKIISIVADPEDPYVLSIATKNLQIVGDLSPEEFEQLREKAKEVLRNVKNTEPGHSIFEILEDTDRGFKIRLDKAQIFTNIESHILIDDREYKITDFLTPNMVSGDHDRLGILIISGKDIKHNNVIESATIYDIVPTILYLIGLPVGADMTGKVLVEAINEHLLKKQSIRYIPTYEQDKKKKEEKPIRYPKSEEEEIKKLMRSLGYIN